MAGNNTTRTTELPQWFNVFVYIALIIILVVFGDTFTMVVGIIGLSIAFIAYFNSVSPEEDSHH